MTAFLKRLFGDERNRVSPEEVERQAQEDLARAASLPPNGGEAMAEPADAERPAQPPMS
ncbi:MAG: hypothetical protein ACRD0D_09880 [Acidimicrobiales bacterium]